MLVVSEFDLCCQRYHFWPTQNLKKNMQNRYLYTFGYAWKGNSGNQNQYFCLVTLMKWSKKALETVARINHQSCRLLYISKHCFLKTARVNILYNPILETRFLLCSSDEAHGTPPQLWNIVDLRLLVKDHNPKIAKPRYKFSLGEKQEEKKRKFCIDVVERIFWFFEIWIFFFLINFFLIVCFDLTLNHFFFFFIYCNLLNFICIIHILLLYFLSQIVI